MKKTFIFLAVLFVFCMIAGCSKHPEGLPPNYVIISDGNRYTWRLNYPESGFSHNSIFDYHSYNAARKAAWHFYNFELLPPDKDNWPVVEK